MLWHLWVLQVGYNCLKLSTASEAAISCKLKHHFQKRQGREELEAESREVFIAVKGRYCRLPAGLGA